jgi:hypothetical protein
MTYVFDIDGTLCSLTDGNYENSMPYVDRIEHVNKLYEAGNRIIIFTARGMRRFCGDSKKSHDQFYDSTYKQLESWGLKFHQLRLGKPEGDLFIDDKGVNDEDYFAADIRS